MEGLRHFCSETLGWDQEETSRIVGPVLKVLESGSKQTRLESYFMKYDDGIKFAEVRSKRLKAVLDGIQGVDDATAELGIDDPISDFEHLRSSVLGPEG